MSDVLSTVLFAKSLHTLSLAHVNLAAEVLLHYSHFKHISAIAMIKSSLFKKPSRKSRYLEY